MAQTQDLSLGQKVGQLILSGIPGLKLERAWEELIQSKRLGGVILYERNIESKDQLCDLTSQLLPCLIAIDQEGAINRLPFGNYETPEAIARILDACGINYNLAPCVDLGFEPRNFIQRAGRCLGSRPDEVVARARAFVDAHRKHKIATALKHFPGHGSSLGDTHKGFVDVSETWRQEELVPYRQLLDHADSIMIAHVYHREWDLVEPASLSKNVITGKLREGLGFQGAVITDDLEMGAIKDNPEEAGVKALNAGADLLLYANHAGDPSLITRVTQAVCQNVDPRRIEEAFVRKSLLPAGFLQK